MIWFWILVIVVGDIYLYIHGARPKDSMWRDEKFEEYRWR